MAEGIFTRRIPWTRKPAYRVGIDYSSSQSKGILASWLFNGVSLNEKDIVSNINLAITGATRVTTLKGQALAFDGTDDKAIAVIPKLPVGAEERTFRFWVYPRQLEDAAILNYGTNANGRLFTITVENITTEHILFRYWAGNRRYPGITLNAWNRVIITVPPGAVNTSDVKVYIAGIERVGTLNGGANQTLNTALSDLSIGAYIPGIGGGFANTIIADFSVHRYAFTASMAREDFINQYLFLQSRSQVIPYTIAAVGGVTGKSNPLYGPLGGPLVGVLG